MFQKNPFVRQYFKAKNAPLPENEVPSRFLKVVKICWLISKAFISITAFPVPWFLVLSPDMFSYHHVSHLCLFDSCALAQKLLKHTAVPITCTQIKQSFMPWFHSGLGAARLTWTLPTQDTTSVGAAVASCEERMEGDPLMPMRSPRRA